MTNNKHNNNEEPLVCGEVYHIYNKSVGNELLFKTDKDYEFFMKKLKRFILPISNLYAYCLIPNHFHFLLKIKEFEAIPDLINDEKETEYLTQKFSSFFISYSRSFNNAHKRLGRLFLQPFKRKLVDDEDYYVYMVTYIHRNPIHHGLVSNYSDWKYSSYNLFLQETKNSIEIDKEEVLGYFYTLNDFIEFHRDNKIKPGIEDYFLE